MVELHHPLTRVRDALDSIPGPPRVHRLSNSEFERLVADLADALGHLEPDGDRAFALKRGSHHPAWQVRIRILDAASAWLPLEAAEEVILDLTHDSVDVVAFHAIGLCGQHRLQAAVSHLALISGWPSTFAKPGYLGKPVGIGAAITIRALLEILGSTQPDELVKREAELLRPYRELMSRGRRSPDTSGMVLIPGGPCPIGTHARRDFRLAYRDYTPEQVVDVPAFYVDARPVTNGQYCDFVRAVEKTGHLACHRDEPLDKDHWPSHLRDPRFGGGDMPVTGVDWYDAYAYAAWCGKKLPTETQWEKAARGADGRDYPWGNDWREGAANYVETSFRQRVGDVDSWQRLLRSVSPEFPETPLWPVGTHPAGDSPYGVSDMAGNVWEWTLTNFFWRAPMEPLFRGRKPLDFTNHPAAFPVIRGGCWTSLPEMLRTFYRGKDLLTDRHFELGFRCVVEV